MDDLRDKADSGVDATRIADAEGTTHIVVSPELHKAGTIGESNESYPRFGDWLETESGWLECPRHLAGVLVEKVDFDDVAFPVEVKISSAELRDEEWHVVAEVSEA